MLKISPESIDQTFKSFLQERDEAVSEFILGELLNSANALISPHLRKRTAGRYKSPSLFLNDDDLDQIRAAAITKLISEIRNRRNNSPPPPIYNFAGFVLSVADSCFVDYLRALNRGFKRESDKIKGVLDDRKEFIKVVDSRGQTRIGLSKWQRIYNFQEADNQLKVLQQDPALFINTRFPHSDLSQVGLAFLIASLLDWLSAPVAINDLIILVAQLRGIRTVQPRPFDLQHDETITNSGAHLHFSSESQAEKREILTLLLVEIKAFSVKQRRVFFLGMHEEKKRGDINLFLLTGTLTIKQIADLCEVPIVWLKQRWKDLPLSDEEISTLIPCTKQQVSNIRKSLYERFDRWYDRTFSQPK